MSPTHADPDRAGRLHHLELSVPDPEAAYPTWEWLLAELGYDRKHDWEDGRSWSLDGAYLVLKRAAEDGAVERPTPGLDHVAFHAASRAQVDRISAGVRDREGTRLLYEDRHPYAGGYYAVYFESPAGITVEVVAPEADD